MPTEFYSTYGEAMAAGIAAGIPEGDVLVRRDDAAGYYWLDSRERVDPPESREAARARQAAERAMAANARDVERAKQKAARAKALMDAKVARAKADAARDVERAKAKAERARLEAERKAGR